MTPYANDTYAINLDKYDSIQLYDMGKDYAHPYQVFVTSSKKKECIGCFDTYEEAHDFILQTLEPQLKEKK
jgi:hypothetical protein